MKSVYYNDGTKVRYIIPDFLRGIAVMGICLANFPEFALYTFQSPETMASMPTAGIDTVVKYLQNIFIDGKFYTIFSLLFGLGFAIILMNAVQSNKNGLRIFYRRMTILLLIGLFHLICLWAGDILILYAFLGLFLPLFRNLPDKKLLMIAAILLLLPVLVDSCIACFGWNLSAPVVRATLHFHAKAGITNENFPVWLVQANDYSEVLQFNVAGAFIRMQEFIEGNRYFKVMGLFLIGYAIGRRRFYATLSEYKPALRTIRNLCFLIGLPLSLVYAWNLMNGEPCGLTGSAALYAFSVFPLSFAYISAICLVYERFTERRQKQSVTNSPDVPGKTGIDVFQIVAASGRMAVTNYLMQSAFGILIFYSIGWGLGAKTGLVHVEWIAFAVFVFQVIYSNLWLRYFRYGPVEWVWRMLTYGKRIQIRILSTN